MPEARATRDAAGLTTIHDDVWTYEPDGRATGLIASPPCQTFSAAGRGAGRKALNDVLRGIRDNYVGDLDHLRFLGGEVGDDRTALVLVPLHFALSGNYEWLAWEQVPAVLPVWEACAAMLRERGWSAWTGYLHAEQYGVPQTRKRAFLLASRTTGEVVPPAPTHSKYHSTSPRRLDSGVLPWVSMAEGIGWGMLGRPSYTVVGGSGGRNTNGTEWGSSAVRGALYRAQEDPEAWRERGWGLTERPSPTVTGGGIETGGAEPIAKLVERWASRPDWVQPDRCASPSGTTGPVHRPILHPAATVTGAGNYETHPADQCGRSTPDSIRITVAEAGILQSFPADFPWQGTKTRQYLQAGNAVPPGMALHALAAAGGLDIKEQAA